MFYPPVLGRLRQPRWWIQLTRNTPKTPRTFIEYLTHGAPGLTIKSAGCLLWAGNRKSLSLFGRPTGPPPLAKRLHSTPKLTVLCYPSPPSKGTWPKTPLPKLYDILREVQWLPRNLTPPTKPKALCRRTQDKPVVGTTSNGNGIPPYRVLFPMNTLTPFYDEN